MDEISVGYSVNVIMRPFNPAQDQAFIYTTWRNGVYYGPNNLREKDSKPVFKELTAKIRDILSKATVKIACLEGSHFVIIGYVVYTGTHLDWVYVKEDYRQKGIASLLVPKEIETVTSTLTKIGKAILEKKKKENEEYGH